MERTMTYKGRTFTIRANETEDGYTESITEVGQHVSQPGYTFDETHEWDGSGIVHPTPDACFAAAEQSIRDTVDEEDSMYQIETRDSRGTWTTDGLGEIDANQFATEQDANAMIAQLRTIGPDWADAEYRVVVIAD